MPEIQVPLGKRIAVVAIDALPSPDKAMEMAMQKIGYALASGITKARKSAGLAKIDNYGEVAIPDDVITTRVKLVASDVPSVTGWTPAGIRLVRIEAAPESAGSAKLAAAKAEAAEADRKLRALMELAKAQGLTLDVSKL